MANIEQKIFLKRFLISVIIFITLMFSVPLFENFTGDILLKVNNNIADKMNAGSGFNEKHISFKVENGDIIAYINNKANLNNTPNATAYVKNNIKIHFYMQIIFVLSISLLFPINRKLLYYSIIIIFTLGYLEIKLWLYIFDQSNHYIELSATGEYITKFKDGPINNLANFINKIINVKGAIYFRYIFTLVYCTLLYLILEKKKASQYFNKLIN